MTNRSFTPTGAAHEWLPFGEAEQVSDYTTTYEERCPRCGQTRRLVKRHISGVQVHTIGGYAPEIAPPSVLNCAAPETPDTPFVARTVSVRWLPHSYRYAIYLGGGVHTYVNSKAPYLDELAYTRDEAREIAVAEADELVAAGHTRGQYDA